MLSIATIGTILRSSSTALRVFPVNIHSEFIKRLGASGFKWLAVLFSTCMGLNLLPKMWRKANIIAILKPDKDAKVPKSYRPISLLCVPFKILERVILSRITPYQWCV